MGVLATSGHSISSSDSKVSDNVYGIIPSYSEALLMSSYTLNGKIIGKRFSVEHIYSLILDHSLSQFV